MKAYIIVDSNQLPVQTSVDYKTHKFYVFNTSLEQALYYEDLDEAMKTHYQLTEYLQKTNVVQEVNLPIHIAEIRIGITYVGLI